LIGVKRNQEIFRSFKSATTFVFPQASSVLHLASITDLAADQKVGFPAGVDGWDGGWLWR
jgi:hypothetical protein